MFFCKIDKTFKNIFFIEHLTTGSEHTEQIEENLIEEYSATRDHCLNFINFIPLGFLSHTLKIHRATGEEKGPS